MTPEQRQDRLDDLAWMAVHGENTYGAAERLGTSREYLDKWARRNAPAIWAELIDHDPLPVTGHRPSRRRP
jgi:hypothetical protein